MIQPLVISYYTPDYKEYFEKLRKSLVKYGIEHHIQEIPDPGTWIEAVNKKPEFILSNILFYKRSALWLDADAIVQRDPGDMFDRINRFVPDVAYHIKEDTKEVLTGTIYFQHNTRSITLLRLWIAECKRYPTIWDQVNLQNVLNSWPSGATLILNPEDCHIFDSVTKPEGGPIVEHFQASRKFRRKGRQ